MGAWRWIGPGFRPCTFIGFSVDDESPAYPLSCKYLPSPCPGWEKHAGSLEALRVTRPEAVDLASNIKRTLMQRGPSERTPLFPAFDRDGREASAEKKPGDEEAILRNGGR